MLPPRFHTHGGAVAGAATIARSAAFRSSTRLVAALGRSDGSPVAGGIAHGLHPPVLGKLLCQSFGGCLATGQRSGEGCRHQTQAQELGPCLFGLIGEAEQVLIGVADHSKLYQRVEVDDPAPIVFVE